MLISYSIENFFSFKDKNTLQLSAAKALTESINSHTFKIDDNLSLLRSCTIYGPNASGKTNFIKAFTFLKLMVLHSNNQTLDQGISLQPYQPFLLNEENESKPSSFSIDFLCDIDGKKSLFKYSVQLNKIRIVSEELVQYPFGRPRKIFHRKGQEFLIGPSFKEGEELISRTKENALFVSVAAQFNSKIALAIVKWFTNFNVVDNADHPEVQNFSQNYWSDKTHHDTLMKYLAISDPSIRDMEIKREQLTADNMPLGIPTQLQDLLKGKDKITTMSKHGKKSSKGQEEVTFDFFAQESAGTRMMFVLSTLIEHTLNAGGVLVIDELGAHLHPLLTRFIINLFNSERNTKNAQLIVTTHDLTLLNRSVFRRDQIWFVERDQDAASHLYSLAEYRTRKDASFDKDYISGRYGALPEIDPTLLSKD